MGVDAAVRHAPRRPWLARFLLPLVRRLAARKTDQGDENPVSIGHLWISVYRWGSCTYGGGQWYDEWFAIVGWRGGKHKTVCLFDAPEAFP
jgi:hypothetical protein